MPQGFKAGDLRHPVVLMKKISYTTDAQGRRTAVWWDECTAYAMIRDVSGRDFYQALAYHAEDTVTITIRYREGITTEWRVRSGETVYEILEVNHLGYKYDYLSLKCRAIHGEGGR